MTEKDTNMQDLVKDYYGKTLSKTTDLQNKSCISTGNVVSKPMREAIAMVHEEVANRYYGCGLAIPEQLEGMHVLDLGSGSGRDCFAASKLVGPNGHVTGIDMTDELLDIARKHVKYHQEKFGFSSPNVDFVKGYIENLTEAGMKENSFDVIISNCVVNLCPDKRAVLAEAYKVLKVGGELYFSDMYADRDSPESVRTHEVLLGEGFAGALYWRDLYKMAAEAGFSTPRMVSASPIPVDKEEFKQILGDTQFASVKYRLFKLPADREEPRLVQYKGTSSGFEAEIQFDHQNTFKAGTSVPVDSELATILACSRFKEVFQFEPVTGNQGEGQADSYKVVDPFQYIAARKQKGDNSGTFCCGAN